MVGIVDCWLFAENVLLKLETPGAHVPVFLCLVLSLNSPSLRLYRAQVNGIFELDGIELPAVPPLVGSAHESSQASLTVKFLKVQSKKRVRMVQGVVVCK